MEEGRGGEGGGEKRGKGRKEVKGRREGEEKEGEKGGRGKVQMEGEERDSRRQVGVARERGRRRERRGRGTCDAIYVVRDDVDHFSMTQAD